MQLSIAWGGLDLGTSNSVTNCHFVIWTIVFDLSLYYPNVVIIILKTILKPWWFVFLCCYCPKRTLLNKTKLVLCEMRARSRQILCSVWGLTMVLLLVASCYRNRCKLWSDGPLDSSTDSTLPYTCIHKLGNQVRKIRLPKVREKSGNFTLGQGKKFVFQRSTLVGFYRHEM